MLRSRANEVPDLIRRLSSGSRKRVDAARARLSIIGARAVEDLIEALEGSNDRIRARVMPLLAMIQDSRGREPLIAMLLDRKARMRGIASRCLARFPAPDSVAALNRVLERDPNRNVRIAAVQALVEQYAAGQDQAIRRLLDLLLDPRQDTRVRVAAFSLLPTLRVLQRRSILKRLASDPNDGIRSRALDVAAQTVKGPGPDKAEIPRWFRSLASEDYATWNEAVQVLGSWGGEVIPPLLDEMRRKANDPEFCTRAGMVLKTLGPRRGRSLMDAAESIEEPLPLQVVVEVIGSFGEKSLIYRLKDLIERLAAKPAAKGEVNGFDLMRRVQAKAHLELARIGSRVAIHDLVSSLGNAGQRAELEMLAAMSLIGKRDEIGLLLRAYQREDPFVRSRIAEAVRTIMKRERVRRNARIFQTLSPEQRRALDAILPPAGERPRRGRGEIAAS